MLRGRSIVNITEDVRKYAAEQAISDEEALKKRMEEPSAARWTIRRIAREGEAQRSQKSKEFVEKGAEVYAKA
jgi:phosphomethylpyrimidine synthase